MNRLTTAPTRRTRRTLSAVAIAAVAVAGPAWAASSGNTAAATTGTPAAALVVTAADTGGAPRTLPAWVPPRLRADLRQLRGMDPQQRQQRATQIWQDALDGDYGVRVQLRAERAQQRYRLLPEQLREDLGELRGLGGDELREHIAAIRDKALDGDYGDQVRQWAERRSDVWPWG
ncbi:hypothetical protein [Streptomyces sp. S.PB5]|uniref:hypothetical protein n=1 Tax=Streptomyces sp. S.PB5 TaxID=3020844 RepID=UPI0025AF2F79|nr:hypothetical protein [Streptomyces sp. S.PB5]MDN3026169.1 hypothetical protein [Streptomyces sp. S.PB5]